MNYRLILSLLLLVGLIVIPVSADLKKIDIRSTVFVGEVGMDISTPLYGCREIAWWPAGNDTSTPPGKIIELNQSVFSYNFSPDIYSGYEGAWYCWNPKPIFKVFDVKAPQMTLKIWDLDHDQDVSGQNIPSSTRITYRIETNLYEAMNTSQRREANPLDMFFDVGLKSPSGKNLPNIFTGSVGVPSTQILPFDSKPNVIMSPYMWRDGGLWNRSARTPDGYLLYPLGMYTFTASQNLNNMEYLYGDKVGVTTSGPINITFVFSATTPSPTSTTTNVATPVVTQTSTSIPTPVPVTSIQTTQPVTPGAKPTWTSTPLSVWTIIAALGVVSALFIVKHWKK
ncbi:MAG: DUF3821 domain-containing protein [Methanoregulaceae archaeon]|jgi:hypothetical protein